MGDGPLDSVVVLETPGTVEVECEVDVTIVLVRGMALRQEQAEDTLDGLPAH